MPFYFRVSIKEVEENLWRKQEKMKNCSSHSSEFNLRDYHLGCIVMEQIAVFVTFQILIVVISVLIVSTSSLVIYQITKVPAKKVRSDFAFIILSVSDIGVGLFSVPLQGILCHYDKHSQNPPLIASIAGRFFELFPYNVSYPFTAVIAVDRLLVITLALKYKNLVTPSILKVIAVILFLISVTISSTLTIRAYNVESRRYITQWVHSLSQWVVVIVGTICIVVVILTHLYILHFALKRPDIKNLRKHYGKNNTEKRLTNTISFICITQLICVFPYLILRFLQLNCHISHKRYLHILPWSSILAYCQRICNGLIILRNKKPRNIFKQIYTKAINMIEKSR